MKNNFFSRAWRGELSLAIVFWVIQFIPTFVFYVIYELFPQHIVADVEGPYFVFILAPYSTFAWICVWRCYKKIMKKEMYDEGTWPMVLALIWASIWAGSTVVGSVLYLYFLLFP